MGRMAKKVNFSLTNPGIHDGGLLVLLPPISIEQPSFSDQVLLRSAEARLFALLGIHVISSFQLKVGVRYMRNQAFVGKTGAHKKKKSPCLSLLSLFGSRVDGVTLR
jgi:hypothetical protein